MLFEHKAGVAELHCVCDFRYFEVTKENQATSAIRTAEALQQLQLNNERPLPIQQAS